MFKCPLHVDIVPRRRQNSRKQISHLITDHHDWEIKIERMLRTLNFKIVPKMCREQGREISINDSTETIHVSKPNKVSKDSPFKKKLIKTAGGASQDTNHGLIGGKSRKKM